MKQAFYPDICCENVPVEKGRYRRLFKTFAFAISESREPLPKIHVGTKWYSAVPPDNVNKYS